MNPIRKTFVIFFGLLLLLGCNKSKEAYKPLADVNPTAMLLINAGTYLTENLYTERADSSIEIDFKKLIAKGAKVDSVDEDSNTALLLLAKTTDSQYFPKTAALAEILLENKADVNSKNYRKFTALHIACSNGNKPFVELLLAHGADVNAFDDSHYTPVVYAVMGNFDEIVKLLTQKGADVTWKDPTDSMSLLEIAERRGYTKTVEILKIRIKSK
jgi:ankyrin repeat protein